MQLKVIPMDLECCLIHLGYPFIQQTWFISIINPNWFYLISIERKRNTLVLYKWLEYPPPEMETFDLCASLLEHKSYLTQKALFQYRK